MLYVVAVVYDSKAQAYLPPVFCSNQMVAMRAFASAANMADHQVGQHPTDFTMFIIGTFNDESAEIRVYPERINLGLAANFVKAPSHVQSENAPQPVGNETQLLARAAGGNSSQQLRPEPRPQNDVRRGVPDTDSR